MATTAAPPTSTGNASSDAVAPQPARRWSRSDTRRLAGLSGVVAALHVVGWGGLALLVPMDLTVGTQVFGFGLGLSAYAFGVRHAFDADHIAVIDGVTRKLTADVRRHVQDDRDGAAARRPLSVGFWFSLGHSSVVFAMAVAVAAGAKFASTLVRDDSTVHQALATFGTSAAGLFLWAIGLVNLAALLVLAGTAAVTLPWYAVLVLPVLFAAGMSLFDTLDGAFMHAAYDRAHTSPLRRLRHHPTAQRRPGPSRPGRRGDELDHLPGHLHRGLRHRRPLRCGLGSSAAVVAPFRILHSAPTDSRAGSIVTPLSPGCPGTAGGPSRMGGRS